MNEDKIITSLVRPIRYEITVEKKGDNFLLKYIEYFDKSDIDHVTAFNNTAKYLETIKANAPSTTAISNMVLNHDDFSVAMEKENSFEDIADQIASEFIAWGRLGKITIYDLFSYISRHECGLDAPSAKETVNTWKSSIQLLKDLRSKVNNDYKDASTVVTENLELNIENF